MPRTLSSPSLMEVVNVGDWPKARCKLISWPSKRDSDEHRNGEDAKRLSAKHASAGRATASPNPSQDTPYEE